MAILFLGLGMARNHAAVATDPKAERLSPQQQLEAASWQAEQSQIEKARVGRLRFEHLKANKHDIIMGLQSEQAKRQELLHPTSETLPSGRGNHPEEQSHPILWTFALCGAGLIGRSILRQAAVFGSSLTTRELLCGLEGEQHFSKFADEFVSGPTIGGKGSVSRNQAEETFERATQSASAEKEGSVGSPLHASLGRIPDELANIRELLSDFGQGVGEGKQMELIAALLSHLRSVKAEAGLPELLHVWQVTCALENLLQQIIRTPAALTLSAMRTIVSAVDLVHSLCVEPKATLLLDPPVRLLAVDDDAISRHAVALALKKVLGQPDLASDGITGLALAQKQAYDAVFLDLEMPGLDGFEVCSLIHGTSFNRNTPVVFVTSHSGFAERSKSSLVGGHDLIGKPFLVFELALRAITLVLRRRLQASPLTSLAASLPPGTKARRTTSEQRVSALELNPSASIELGPERRKVSPDKCLAR